MRGRRESRKRDCAVPSELPGVLTCAATYLAIPTASPSPIVVWSPPTTTLSPSVGGLPHRWTTTMEDDDTALPRAPTSCLKASPHPPLWLVCQRQSCRQHRTCTRAARCSPTRR